jgi:hypothetical protein
MNVRDWRDADPSDTQVFYAREQEYWVRELAWDASSAWREIEQARVTWGLPGFIAIDANRTVRGWAYFLPEGETAHLGGVVADTREATNALLDACLESALRPPRPARVSCFLPARAEGFEEALRERQFTCEHYRYLSRPIATGTDTAVAQPWTTADLLPAATLLRESYGLEGKHFAPRGTPEEWEQYVRSLVERPGCGVIEPTVTRAGHEDSAGYPASATGGRPSDTTPRGSRPATRRRCVSRGCGTRRQAGNAAGCRQQRQRPSTLRKDGVYRRVDLHCGHARILTNALGL